MAQRFRIREADPSRGSAWNLRNASSRSASVDFGLRIVSFQFVAPEFAYENWTKKYNYIHR